ncbi:hypothetical protein JMJ35_009304 [Cladonia borealis]|uniref:Uncharacterized protein n=1 Tax=Cladonia borealis TaxID=184061 RepID=A0AA39QUC6_9LECA|nr:hypothetical protein JMJ35_009304 [Cladonia borealis]
MISSNGDRSPETSQGSQPQKSPSQALEQWRNKSERHEQVAVGHNTSRPSEAQMKALLDKVQRKAEGK